MSRRLQGGFIPFETAPGKPDIDQFCLIVTDITAAKTAENDLKRYATPDFHPTRQHLSRDIRLKNKRVGHIDIYGFEDMPITGDCPFLEEEKALMDSVALRLGHAIEGIHAEKQILHLQKTESLGRMAGAMAHHYNNLLTSVMGNLEMAMDDLPDDHPISGNLEQAMHAARRISKLGATMLTYLGQTNTPRKRLDLSEICQAAIPSLQADIPEIIGFKTQLPLPGPVVLANAEEITQILISLVTNAREALAAQSGTIAVSICPVSSGSIPVGTQCFPMDFQPGGSDFACIRVQDSGPGIPDTMLEKIFDPFYSTRFTGRGLGLPIVLGTVKSLGGCITVATTPGSGAVFQVFLPVSQNPTPRNKQNINNE
ncbi:MAG: hypothetical protein K9K63_03770 [Desulfotignum sp.]|nr:hypothetical protein [Desulfotignum sp.]MCF8088676.1 hypothetical protein [Desulfotignum sp.]MCF8136406.1 hypothetical protein [Desulfotignum sp.]